ncbi:GNAT family N-acetyltransferase [Phenylobacterium soli]|uniref:GNAT family N-acetyltransferase n=1 Tax=Phenylobacterium soli TaxID=2170551 RepID=A0A328AIP2_9CAUL|nr:GNAT family N-acetyltransferase [Phenylobacterium soli]RAK54650.1 GNAT family N-acetyltransferase [Phenylobacterium soli]
MSEPTLRRATTCDAEALAAIGARTFADTFAHLYPPEDLEVFLAEAYDVDHTREDLADPRRAAWLVEADGDVIGYAQVGPCGLPHPEVTDTCGELKRFYFLKDWQNRGLGGKLFGAAMDWLERHYRDLWIGVWSENHGAQRFYLRHGFEKVGEYGFKVGRTIDHEFILRRRAADVFPAGKEKTRAEHNPAKV